jgi:hypothetical protein
MQFKQKIASQAKLESTRVRASVLVPASLLPLPVFMTLAPREKERENVAKLSGYRGKERGGGTGETSALEQHSHASQKIIVSENHLAAPLPKNVTTVTKLAPLAVPRVSLF